MVISFIAFVTKLSASIVQYLYSSVYAVYYIAISLQFHIIFINITSVIDICVNAKGLVCFGVFYGTMYSRAPRYTVL